jgi:hypothetical protein
MNQQEFDNLPLNQRLYLALALTNSGEVALRVSGLNGASAYEIWINN